MRNMKSNLRAIMKKIRRFREPRYMEIEMQELSGSEKEGRMISEEWEMPRERVIAISGLTLLAALLVVALSVYSLRSQWTKSPAQHGFNPNVNHEANSKAPIASEGTAGGTIGIPVWSKPIVERTGKGWPSEGWSVSVGGSSSCRTNAISLTADQDTILFHGATMGSQFGGVSKCISSFEWLHGDSPPVLIASAPPSFIASIRDKADGNETISVQGVMPSASKESSIKGISSSPSHAPITVEGSNPTYDIRQQKVEMSGWHFALRASDVSLPGFPQLPGQLSLITHSSSRTTLYALFQYMGDIAMGLMTGMRIGEASTLMANGTECEMVKVAKGSNKRNRNNVNGDAAAYEYQYEYADYPYEDEYQYSDSYQYDGYGGKTGRGKKGKGKKKPAPATPPGADYELAAAVHKSYFILALDLETGQMLWVLPIRSEDDTTLIQTSFDNTQTLTFQTLTVSLFDDAVYLAGRVTSTLVFGQPQPPSPKISFGKKQRNTIRGNSTNGANFLVRLKDGKVDDSRLTVLDSSVKTEPLQQSFFTLAADDSSTSVFVVGQCAFPGVPQASYTTCLVKRNGKDLKSRWAWMKTISYGSALQTQNLWGQGGSTALIQTSASGSEVFILGSFQQSAIVSVAGRAFESRTPPQRLKYFVACLDSGGNVVGGGTVSSLSDAPGVDSSRPFVVGFEAVLGRVYLLGQVDRRLSFDTLDPAIASLLIEPKPDLVSVFLASFTF